MTKPCYHNPLLTLHVAQLCVDKGKRIIRECWNIIARKRTIVPILEKWNAVYYLTKSNVIHESLLNILSNNSKHVDCNCRHSFSYYNDFSNMFQSSVKVKLQSQRFSNQLWIMTMFGGILH